MSHNKTKSRLVCARTLNEPTLYKAIALEFLANEAILEVTNDDLTLSIICNELVLDPSRMRDAIEEIKKEYAIKKPE